MSDLLKRFVELAPKELFCVVKDDLYSGFEDKWCIVAKTGEYDRTFPEPNPYVRSMRLDLTDDRASAEAIIFLWDYLEGEGWSCYLESPDVLDREKDVYVFGGGKYEPIPDKEKATRFVPMWAECGATRIEALVRACVAYWEAKQ